MAPLLGLGHQRGLDLHYLGSLCRLPARNGNQGLERQASRVAWISGVLVRYFQLHDCESILQGTARLLGSIKASSSDLVVVATRSVAHYQLLAH